MPNPMSYGDLLMDVITGPPKKRKKPGFAARVRNEIAAATKRKRKAKTKNGKGGVR